MLMHYFFTKKSIFIVSLFFVIFSNHALPSQAIEKGFVYLHDIDPTILVSLRYYSDENFVGARVDGYKKPVVVMTHQAAQALKAVQVAVKKDGYSLVVYDAYRPQRAVDNFVRWGKNLNDQTKKSYYYPRVTKDDVFDLEYVMKRSGHSRGSTVDCTLIKDGQQLHAVVLSKRTLLDGFMIMFLDDGTVDMGSSFDLFDVASHVENSCIEEKYKTMRLYLKTVMERHGFKGISDEWWHFTLKGEPFPRNDDASYFDFVIE
jgi:D-alanyl-D-alanine dipeptidase